MAKAVANCRCSVCGKTFDVVSYKRNRAEADRFVEWAEGYITECRECERAEEHARALEESEGMPELAGSEKQVKWAIDIRARLTREVEDGRFNSKHLAICWKSVVASKTDARFWIDNRNTSVNTIVGVLLREEPEIFEQADEAAECVKTDVYAELDRIAESAAKDGKQDVVSQIEQVRRYYVDNFARESVTPIAILKCKLSGSLSARAQVKASLEAGRVWDSEQRKWVRPADAHAAEATSGDVTLYDIDDHIKGSEFAEMVDGGVIIHAYMDKEGNLLPTDAHPSDAQDMSEYIRFADLGLPDDCTAEEAYAAMDTRINGYYRSALHHFAQRVNAQRSRKS